MSLEKDILSTLEDFASRKDDDSALRLINNLPKDVTPVLRAKYRNLYFDKKREYLDSEKRSYSSFFKWWGGC